MTLLNIAIIVGLLLMIVLPLSFRWADEQLGYIVLLIGGGIVWLALRLGIVGFEGGCFVQTLLQGQRSDLHLLLQESWLLIAVYFFLSLLAAVFHRSLKKAVREWARIMSPPVMIFLWTLVAGSLGAFSIVVLAVVGAIFFDTLQEVTGKSYTPCIIIYAAALGLSALLSTIGEPLSLIIAHELGEDTPYLLKTFGGVFVINIVYLSLAAWFFATKAVPLPQTTEERMRKDVRRAERLLVGKSSASEIREALHTVEDFELEAHDFSHTLEHLLHSTTKLYFFVVGLLFFGEAAKPIARTLLAHVSPFNAFFGNVVSTVADNALLGLLEIQHGMPQDLVFVLGISLALWGVGLVTGNVCNIILKEKLEISFGEWAAVGIPCACSLALINITLYESGIARWLMF